jgi:tetraacyldisaccharide 4'-kinase
MSGSSAEQFAIRVLSGQASGIVPTLLRGATRLAEPFYSGIMSLRNRLYDRQVVKTHSLPRATISVGNLTTGGTGKTPVVMWLAEQLRLAGRRPAVLLRGYKGEGLFSDEAVLLDSRQNTAGPASAVPIAPNRDRIAAARKVIAEEPLIDVFILDDGFQHRRAARDINLLLVDATRPFGFGHVLPRGLLREPISGIRRAGCILITRAGHVDSAALNALQDRLRAMHPSAPVFRADHHVPAFVSGKRVFAFAGIGNPESFLHGLTQGGAIVVGSRTFSDHYSYLRADLERLAREARRAGADLLVTTEKDWVKVERFRPGPVDLPLQAARLELRFFDQDEQRLLEHIKSRLEAARTNRQ